MFESNPNIPINAFFALIVVTISSFSFVLFKLRGESYPAVSVRHFSLYFATGILFWVSLWMKEAGFLSVGYSALVVLYVLASMFLLLAVLNYEGKPRLPITLVAIHLIVILVAVFVNSAFQSILVEGLYTLVVYPVIALTALKRAYLNRDIGTGIVGLAGILAFVVSVVQLYGVLVAENLNPLYAASIILLSISFLLVGIGFLISMLVSGQKQLKSLAINEPMTGLYTRLGMVHAVKVPLALLRRSEGYIGAMVIDIDFFEKIKDNYGHDAGDLVLVEVAKILQGNTRDTDIICRLGGERFVVLLPGESEYTVLVAERLRKAIEKATFSHGGREINCTSSFGVASQSANKDFDYLLNIADKALQRAISEGRNRVCRDVE